jgi:hypothetical protein
VSDDIEDEDEVIICPHGHDALSECPICDVTYYELDDEESEACQILLDHAILAGPSRSLIDKMLRGEGRDYDSESMLELFQMHTTTLHKYQK